MNPDRRKTVVGICHESAVDAMKATRARIACPPNETRPMPRRDDASPFLPQGHDHAPCLAETLRRAGAAAEASGLRLTPLRKRVLEEIASCHTAVGAYEILDRLARKGGTRLAPISIYRALEALIGMGVIHRLESRNAYFACHADHAGSRRRPIILSCETCHTVAEVDSPAAMGDIERSAKQTGFVASRVLVEVVGLCAGCSAAAAKASRT